MACGASFVCLDAKSGKQLWETDKVTDRKSGASVHATANGNSVLLYNDGGELIRAQLASEGYREVSRLVCSSPRRILGTQVRVGGAGLCESPHLCAHQPRAGAGDRTMSANTNGTALAFRACGLNPLSQFSGRAEFRAGLVTPHNSRPSVRNDTRSLPLN
jgi:outer membrane protein assembly factor BamB